MTNSLFNALAVPCTCEGWSDESGMCACANGRGEAAGAEKVLRFVMSVDGNLTPEQREFCLREIDKVEGHSRVDHEADSAPELAHATIDAWIDYCRDKGLL